MESVPQPCPPSRQSQLLRFFPLFLFLLTLAFHLWKINQDLPSRYNPDEPHHLHVAAHFSTGDLNPHDYKYPTLWPYTVAMLLGLICVIGWFLGFIHSAHEFAVLFFQQPTLFYLPVRMAAAFFISLTPPTLYMLGRRYYSNTVAVAIGLFCAFSPMINGYGREATNYPIFYFLMAATLLAFHGVAKAVDPSLKKPYIISGVCLGLTMASHHLAILMSPILIGFYLLLPKNERRIGNLAIAFATAFTVFTVIFPFLLLDIKDLLATFSSYHKIQRSDVFTVDPMVNSIQIAKNTLRFVDFWGIGFVFCLIGGATRYRNDVKRLLVLIAPLALFYPYLIRAQFGSVDRYAYPVLIPFFILAAQGFEYVWNALAPRRWLQLLVGVLVFAPSFFWSAKTAHSIGLIDTRTIAKEWIQKNILPGKTFLLYAPYHSVDLNMTRRQLTQWRDLTHKAQHPREKYYQLLLDGSTTDGFEIYYLKRSTYEVMDVASKTEKSLKALPTLDADTIGVEGLRRLGVNYVVLDDSFLSMRQNMPWIVELQTTIAPVFSIAPDAGKTKGPVVAVYPL